MAWHREDWRGRDAAAAGPIHHRQRQRIGTLTVGDRMIRGSLHLSFSFVPFYTFILYLLIQKKMLLLSYVDAMLCNIVFN